MVHGMSTSENTTKAGPAKRTSRALSGSAASSGSQASSTSPSGSPAAFSWSRAKSVILPEYKPGSTGLAKLVLHDLARGVQREGVQEGDVAGHLEAGHPRLAPGDQLVGGDGAPGHHERLADLSHPLVGDADHGGLGDGRVLHQEPLDLGRVGVEPADDEHVLLAADDLQVAAVVDRAEVTGVQPAVGVDGLFGGGGVVEVAAHDGVAAGQHLAVGRDAQLEALAGGADRRRDVLE